MKQDAKRYIEPYILTGNTIPYKGLNLNLVLVKDYGSFLGSIDVLNINKDVIPDARIMQMSYLGYILNVLFKDESECIEGMTMGQLWMTKFQILFDLILNKQGVEIKTTVNTETGIFLSEIVIDDIKLNANEFDFLRKIILFANLEGFEDEFLSEDIAEEIRKKRNIQSKGIDFPTLEDKMAIITSVNGLTKKDLKDMSYREFWHIFNFCQKRIDYQSAFGKTKEPIEHWIYHKKHSIVEDAFASKGNSMERLMDESK